MTDRSKLLALAEAVEKLTGPDREADVRISLGLSGVEHSEEDVADLLRVRDEPTGYGKYRPADEYVPRYTASLDAAMKLVPEGWNWDAGDHTRRGPIGIVENGELAFTGVGFWPNPARRWFEVRAATPAISLCAAALRAQAEALA